jgi:hypothetical protein
MPRQIDNRVAWSLLVVLYLGLFFILELIAHKTAWELAGPYLVIFVLPVPIFVLVASWLRKWEKRKPSPKLLAFCWGLTMAALAAGVNSALFYFGAEFHVFDPTLGDFIYVVGAITFIVALMGYFQVLPIITARANTDLL